MRSRALSIAANSALVLVSLFVGLALFEIAFRVYPEAFPDNLRAMIETDDASRHTRKAVVQRLPHSPFAKPQPNVDVFIPGYYGPRENFVYEWRSDRRGFKNLPEIAAHDRVDVVAVGDSFTEGMGVATQDTWATRLTRKGHLTYSFGIQGYAPTQFLGTYEHFGRALQPKWVIIGLLGNTYKRESQFLGEAKNADNWSNKKAPTAIGRLLDQDERNEQRPIYLETKEGFRVPVMIRERHRYLTTAVAALMTHRMQFKRNYDIKSGVADPDNDIRFAPDLKALSLYRSEVIANPEITPEALTNSPEWASTVGTIERIAQLAKMDGARVLLAFFPGRGTAYYSRVIGRNLPEHSSDLVQAIASREVARRAGIEFLDLTPEFIQAAAGLTDNTPIDTYPFLKIDGHPSPRGHEIIAEAFAKFINAHKAP